MTVHDDFYHLEVEIERLRAVLRSAEDALLGNAGSDNVRIAKALQIIRGDNQQEPNATGGVDLAVLRGQVLLLNAENERLRARVEQLEAALMAVALNRPVGCDDNGRLKALPLDNPPLSNGPPCHPGAFWKAEETTGGNVAVCSVCGGRGGYST